MKRKVLVTMLCLAISVSAIACGTENTAEQQEVIATEQTAEAKTVEEQETETQQVETQETEIEETADNAEDAINYDDYEELVSVPVDGRDGSQENPYQVGDKICLPKVCIAPGGEEIYSSITLSIDEVTSEYVKISYEFGADFWNQMTLSSWYDVENIILPRLCNNEFEIIGDYEGKYTAFGDIYSITGNYLTLHNELNNDENMQNSSANTRNVVLYYQNYKDFKGKTEDTAYIQVSYRVMTMNAIAEARQHSYYVKVTE